MKKIINILSTATVCAALALGAVSCSNDAGMNDGGGGGSEGKGGSMARFAVMGDYMYIVDHSTLKTIRLTDPAHPDHLQYKDKKPDGWNAGDIETIFPDMERNLLFIGSQSAMYIYDATDPEFLTPRGKAQHFTSCDPVVAYGDYAYVTLNTMTRRCGIIENNTLNIYDISYLDDPGAGAPLFMGSIQMNGPRGLGIDGARKRLFVCDKGLNMYDISNPLVPKMIADLQNSVGGIIPGIIDTYDVIPLENKAFLILTGSDGLFLFNYGNDDLELLDHIRVKKL